MDSQELHDSGQAPPGQLKSRSVSPHPSPQPQYTDPTALDPSVTVASSFIGYNAAYLSAPAGAQSLAPPDQAYPQNTLQVPPPPPQPQHQPSAEDNFSALLNTNPADFDFSVYQNHSPNSVTSADYDSALLLDPMHGQSSRPVSHSVNPADLVSQIPSPHSGASPQLSPQDHQQPMSPPSSTPGTYYTPQHSRHTSLDPATAAYMTGNAPDWQAVMNNAAFQSHRRAPSEVSEVSSAAHSPYLSQHESFDGLDNNPSPLLAPQNDPSLFDNALGIESFTLSDAHQSHAQGISPGHSPYISPQLMPQQGGEMVPNMPYVTAPQGGQYPTPPTNDMYGNGTDMNLMGDIGQASQMAPPSINVEFAPPSRDPSYQPSLSKPSADFDSLSPPPMRRGRSKSDPYTHPASRSRTPVSTSSLEPLAPSSPRSLSPFDVNRQPHSNPSSREPSPSRSNRRLSTSSIDSRNYILGLADPGRPGASPNDSKRVQKHPATFQCHLCPKRFTRAYNLRSHLRTHTDERPFVCTVCGKAFARQHDRKRHEGLHSGEKKFVCRGDLSRGGQWGCGRRFARADALGRHFRSEAGRICIKPLLDEESHERERSLMDQQQQQHLQPIPPPLMVPSMDGPHASTFVLPAALLAQYPALQTLQWDQIPAGPEDPSDMGGRSSFDASSGGEFGLDDDDSGLSVSGMSGGYPSSQDNIYVSNQGGMLG